tara:strand:+ start:998 stop:1225 length:228 start_codon:yes stop_codon:yes gene_type:complete
MKKYLVTEAARSICPTIAKKLINYDNEVWTIDNFSTGSKQNLPKEIIFIIGDLQDRKSIKMLNNTMSDAILNQII